VEEVDGEGEGDEYQHVQQFITDSPWAALNLMTTVATRTSALYARQLTSQEQEVGSSIDESAHLKKGTQSVGVAGQDAGVLGKVDTCQVGVDARLGWQTHTRLINTRLFLPDCWTEDEARGEQAGIPEATRGHQTKPQLAFEMLHAEMKAGVRFGWGGGDGLYGHGYDLSSAVDDLGLTFLFDVHGDQLVYLEQPVLAVPEKQPGRGRTPTLPRPDAHAIPGQADQAGLGDADWHAVDGRDTAKGVFTLALQVKEVWVWEGREHPARRGTLVISRNEAESKLKYSRSNADAATTPLERFAYMQAQRYWVERSFQDAKSEFGMSDDQVRKWQGGHHHRALVLLAMSCMVRERLLNQQVYPLLRCRDVRMLMIAVLTEDRQLVDKRLDQMRNRHKQRQQDIQRHFKT